MRSLVLVATCGTISRTELVIALASSLLKPVVALAFLLPCSINPTFSYLVLT